MFLYQRLSERLLESVCLHQRHFGGWESSWVFVCGIVTLLEVSGSLSAVSDCLLETSVSSLEVCACLMESVYLHQRYLSVCRNSVFSLAVSSRLLGNQYVYVFVSGI